MVVCCAKAYTSKKIIFYLPKTIWNYFPEIRPVLMLATLSYFLLHYFTPIVKLSFKNLKCRIDSHADAESDIRHV